MTILTQQPETRVERRRLRALPLVGVVSEGESGCFLWTRWGELVGDGEGVSRQHFHGAMRVLASRAAMPGSPVELRVGGQTYRVVASAEETELQRLAGLVDERLRTLTPPGRPLSPQALLLAAIALAHDLEQERRERARLEERSREMLTTLLARIDAALEQADPPGDEVEPTLEFPDPR